MEETIPAKISNRKKREMRLCDYEGLAAYANMADNPESWMKFRQLHPEFFPDYLTDWLYETALDWWNSVNPPDVPPSNWYEDHVRAPGIYSDKFEAWIRGAKSESDRIKAFGALPLLLNCRNFLRNVWTRNDPTGACLMYLLGFERQAGFTHHERFCAYFSKLAPQQPDNWKGRATYRKVEPTGFLTFVALPPGFAIVEPDTAEILWEFGCEVQRDVYNLMRERWRAKVCSQCHKYFIADKTAQKYCSTRCCGENKREKARLYYHRIAKVQKHRKPLERETTCEHL